MLEQKLRRRDAIFNVLTVVEFPKHLSRFLVRFSAVGDWVSAQRQSPSGANAKIR
jgi:hypothetical protein